MNYFVNLSLFKSYKRVNYYTLKVEGEELTETDKFFSRFEKEKEYEEDLNNLVAWIEEIGEYRGAKPFYFRFEESAEALPPPAKFLFELPVRDLRLYCIRLSEEIVILANGGIKTSQKVSDSPDLVSKFRFTNRISRKLNDMIIHNEVEFSGKTIHDLENIEIEI